MTIKEMMKSFHFSRKSPGGLFTPDYERSIPKVQLLGPCKTRDVAFTFRMGAGVPGTVTRTHPASIFQALIDKNAPPLYYGQAVLIDATTLGVRPFAAGDTAVTAAYGITVRPYPLQQNTANTLGSASPAFGGGTPPTTGVIDILVSGAILVQINTGNSTKNGVPYIWCAATSGSHTQGLWEVTSSGGNTATLSGNNNSIYNGVQDSSGVVELLFNC